MNTCNKDDILLGVIRDEGCSELICNIAGAKDFKAVRNALVVFALNDENFFEAMVDVVNAVIDDEDMLRGQMLRAQVEGHLTSADEE